MKRLRKKGGARDILAGEGIELLSASYGAARALEFGYELARDEWVAICPPV